jgi:hypothetical protein
VLEEHSPFDLDGVLGVCHAVGVAPTVLPPSAWVRLIFPEGLEELEQEEVDACIGLLMRQHHEVLHALGRGFTLTPEPGDVDGCESFARGYVAAARLDPAWRDVHSRWALVRPFAHLAGLRDLVSPGELEEASSDIQPEADASIRRQMGALIVGARDSFDGDRRGTAAQPPHAPGIRAGHGDTCRCGSGKKRKRCCAVKNDAMH